MSGGRDAIVVTTLKAFAMRTNGSPIILRRGDTLPDDLKPGEKKRLAEAGALGRRKAATTPTPDPAAAGDGAGGDGTAAHEDIDVLGMDVPTLAKFLAEGKDGKPFNATEVVAMAEHDDPAVAAQRASHLLEGENHRSGNDARGTVAAPLAKLIEAAPSGD